MARPEVKLDKEEMRELIEDFLNENSLWSTFEWFLQSKGYRLEDFGLDDE